MKLINTPFEGLLLLEPRIFEDARGYFFESFNRKSLRELGIDFEFVQDNQSYSERNVIRGLHYQGPPHAQTKLIRVTQGKIMDVVVDLRQDQPTFKRTFSVELSSENKKQLLIPKGFAHGFSVLSDNAEVMYKCDDFYYPELELGIVYNDPTLSIDWGISDRHALISAKDKSLPGLSKAVCF